MKYLVVILALVATSANAWTPPDFQAVQALQQARDNAREMRQRERLEQTRRDLTAAKNRASRDDRQFRALQAQLETLQQTHGQRAAALQSQQLAVSDLYTSARQTAGDLITMLRNSPTAPPSPALEQSLGDLAASSRALDLTALGGLWEGLHATLNQTATQSRNELPVQTAPGVVTEQTVTRIGTVLAVAGDRPVVYDRLANLYRVKEYAGRKQHQHAAAITQADTGLVHVPFEPGTTTPATTPALSESLRESGPIGWLIVVLGLTGLLVLLLRAGLLYRLLRAEKRAVANSAGTRLRLQRDSHSAESGESIAGWLNAALRREVHRAQWGHTLLSVIIGVAPLLGLLGTVTGMILTFHALRLYGSGDPILMAEGIARALSTTMLGLTVAIPLLIGQRWLLVQSNRHVRRLDALVLSLSANARSAG